MSEIFNALVEIPQQLENLSLPNPSLLALYKNLGNRVIWIDSEIDRSTLDVARYIQQFNMEDNDVGIKPDDRQPIRIFIHSEGGDADVTFAITDVIMSSATPVYTINAGFAASGGAYILMAGHRRFCTKKSRAMIHTGSTCLMGTFEQVESYTEDYKRIVKEMEEYVLERTGMDKKILLRKKSKDWYLSAEEQLKHGLVDCIIGSEGCTEEDTMAALY